MKQNKLLIMFCAVALSLPFFSACDDGDDDSRSSAAILVAYIADQDTDGIDELYVANPGSAASSVKVSDTMSTTANDVSDAK